MSGYTYTNSCDLPFVDVLVQFPHCCVFVQVLDSKTYRCSVVALDGCQILTLALWPTIAYTAQVIKCWDEYAKQYLSDVGIDSTRPYVWVSNC